MRTAEVVEPLPHTTLAYGNGAEAAGRQYPKYYVVKGHLAEMLARLGPGEPLPAERALADTFSTSRTTIRQALQELTIEGKLVRMQGRGTFAALPKMAQPLQLTSYTEDMRRQGLPARSRLLSAGFVKADEELARRLDMRPRARVLRVERLRMAGDEPMAIETTHLEAARFPGLAKRLGDSVSLYALLAQDYGVHLAEAEETIETVPAAPREAEMLDTNIGYPMLLLSRHSRDEAGRPVEFALSFYRGDRYKFVAQLRPPLPAPRPGLKMVLAGEPLSGAGLDGHPGREPGAASVFAVAAGLVQQLLDRQSRAMEEAGAVMADRLMQGGTGYAFGTGHSRCVAMELAGRAGGLAPMRELVLDDLVDAGMATKAELHDGTLERRPEAARALLAAVALSAEDFFVISSHSGCNGAPVEMATRARSMGLPVIAITSLEHSRAVPSRHPSGSRLFEVATHCIDTCAPYGDTAINLGEGIGVCSVSSFAGVLVAQALTAEVVRRYLATGSQPPLLMSRNLPPSPRAARKRQTQGAGRLE